jgi:hypothetical protein
VRVRRLTVIVLVGGLCCSALTLPAAARSRVTGRCSRATANRLITQLPVAGPVLGFYSGLTRAVCVDFDRDGRTDMVVTMWVAMNHGAHYWAAYRAEQGRYWKRLIFGADCCGGRNPRFGGIDLYAHRQGHDFVVSEPIFAPSDPLCCPSGGVRSATWQWRAGRLRIKR